MTADTDAPSELFAVTTEHSTLLLPSLRQRRPPGVANNTGRRHTRWHLLHAATTILVVTSVLTGAAGALATPLFPTSGEEGGAP